MSKTVIILGAGSSASYGFPTGEVLKNIILKSGMSSEYNPLDLNNEELEAFNLYYSECQQYYLRKFPSVSKDDFITSFRKSSSYSIDTFLSSGNQEEAIVSYGQFLLSTVISYFESVEQLLKESEDNWIEYFFYRNISFNLNFFKQNTPQIISFNYDSFFENKLIQHLENEHHLGNPLEFIQDSNFIHHVYGKLKSERYPQKSHSLTQEVYKNDPNSDFQMLGSFTKIKDIQFEKVLQESKRISFVRGPRDNPINENRISEIQKITKEANKIIILGYAFDRFNNQILFQDTSFFDDMNREIFYTNFGLANEIRYSLNDYISFQSGAEDYDEKSKELLMRAMPPLLFPS